MTKLSVTTHCVQQISFVFPHRNLKQTGFTPGQHLIILNVRPYPDVVFRACWMYLHLTLASIIPNPDLLSLAHVACEYQVWIGSKRQQRRDKNNQTADWEGKSENIWRQMLLGLPYPLNHPFTFLPLSLCLFPFSLSHGCNYAHVNKWDQRETSGIPVGPVGAVLLAKSHRMTHAHTEDVQVKLILSYNRSLSVWLYASGYFTFPQRNFSRHFNITAQQLHILLLKRKTH